jgi:hypothetical protein
MLSVLYFNFEPVNQYSFNFVWMLGHLRLPQPHTSKFPGVSNNNMETAWTNETWTTQVVLNIQSQNYAPTVSDLKNVYNFC